jgi:predicted metal-binding protein
MKRYYCRCPVCKGKLFEVINKDIIEDGNHKVIHANDCLLLNGERPKSGDKVICPICGINPMFLSTKWIIEEDNK